MMLGVFFTGIISSHLVRIDYQSWACVRSIRNFYSKYIRESKKEINVFVIKINKFGFVTLRKVILRMFKIFLTVLLFILSDSYKFL